MSERAPARDTFLGNVGWAGAVCTPLAADASFRSYHRVRLKDRAAVLMDAPPADEDIRPFARVARYLISLGFSAPRILAEDEKRGFLLLEDLGDATYTRVLDEGGEERPLYELAIDTLVQLHQLSAPDTVPTGTPPYDMAALMDEALLFVDWYLPALGGKPLGQVGRDDYDAVWRESLAEIATRRETLVLRDYHVDNLMWLGDRIGTARCGLLDFQDAVVGARAYDLMSLLEDARRDIDPALVEDMLGRYMAGMAETDDARLRRDMALLGAARHAKVIGIFTRLSRRDGKHQYLAHIPRVWTLLARSLSHPALAPVAHWFERHVPATMRRRPDPPADA